MILRSARAAFAEQGLNGTRLDAIAQAAGVDKRLIYYYFDSKERLFVEVLVEAIADIRGAEAHLHLTDLDPIDAIKRLIRFSWDYYLSNPEFVRLINSENLHRARHLATSDQMHRLNQPLVDTLAVILTRGHAAGQFRDGVDPLQLYMSLVGLTYYYVSNQHTLSLMFQRDLMKPAALDERLSHVNDVILAYLRDFNAGQP